VSEPREGRAVASERGKRRMKIKIRKRIKSKIKRKSKIRSAESLEHSRR
jgi:hypothetical protein